jgi:HAMP domain-containing protein
MGATLAPAAGDIVMAACQRSIALHAHWINESVSRTLEHARPDAQGDAAASPTQQGEWVRAAMFEPTWHYMVGLMSLGRTTGDSLVTLMSSQMRGAQDEVDAISRDAHEDAVEAAQTAATAAVAAMTCCAQAVSHLSERATMAARKAAQGQGAVE